MTFLILRPKGQEVWQFNDLFSFSPSIEHPWRFLPWSPCLHLKLHGTPLVLFSVNLAPLTFPSLEPLLALETTWRISLPFLRQFGAPDVFFPEAPTCTWNCMAPLSSFSPSIWRPLHFLPWSPYFLLETAWHPSRPFLHQFGASDVFFPGAPACTWNCMAPLSSFAPSIWRHWHFLPWNPCLHLKLHGAPLVLCSVNLAPLTFFFPGAPACTWNCMAPFSSFSPSIWRPWRFLLWSPYFHLKLHGAPIVLFSVNLAPLTFSSLEPLLALETAWRPSRPFLRQFGAPDVFFPRAPACIWNCMGPLSSYWFNFLSFFFLSCSLFLPFFFLIPFFSSFSLFSPLSLFPFLSFFPFFGAPLVTPGGPGPQSPPPKIRPCSCTAYVQHSLFTCSKALDLYMCTTATSVTFPYRSIFTWI